VDDQRTARGVATDAVREWDSEAVR
jgi:hypothetical protein